MIRKTTFPVSVSAVLAVVLGCNSNPCPPDKMQGFFEVSPAQSFEAAREFCNFSGSMGELIEAASKADPSQRAALTATAVNNDIDMFERVCPDAEAAFKEMSNVKEEQIKGWLYDRCGLSKLGLLDRKEVDKIGFSELWAGSMVYGWLTDKKVPEARRFARHMMALE